MAVESFRYPSFLFDKETLTGIEVVYRSGIERVKWLSGKSNYSHRFV